MNRKKYYTVKNVAELLNISPWTVYDWINAGDLEVDRIGPKKRTIRIPAKALENIIETQPTI